jgi:DNA polymerase (family 10)
MANGLDETRALAQAARGRALNGRFDGLTLLAGIECDILPDGRLDLGVDSRGHATGRLLLKRDPLRLDRDAVIGAAARHGTAIEINCQTHRLDVNESHARAARERGARLVISTDAHSAGALAAQQWGIQIARRAWLGPDDVLNTRSLEDLRPLLRRHRKPRHG